ncbi:hypothetical protein E3N88_38345 [Mikania micrantha]|uniref:PGG domain-containing protein n=1 Tax=Mikania micrantha TaxID=192012 RepID=A0A5N6LTP7_9ASTR|nr:hypothetical protein E3N88_38345 [Mikania micrantha]
MGDWETAKFIFDKHPNLVRFNLGDNFGTTLHVVATAEETDLTLNFVKNLVNMMTREELELKNNQANTAFWIASASGRKKMAKIMIEKNRSLLDIRGNGRKLPLSVSAMYGIHSMVKYLYKNSQKMTGDHWKDKDKSLTLSHCVQRDFFDVALQILEDHPKLDPDVSLLEVLARKPYAFKTVEKNLITRIIVTTLRFFHMKVQPTAEEDTESLKLLKAIWGKITRKMNLKDIKVKLKGNKALFVAAEMGNTWFIVELLRTYPGLMFEKNKEGHTIFHIAVMNRHQGIYNLLYEIGSNKNNVCNVKDEHRNNMLHLVGKSSKKMAAKTSGASLLMQRELLWFKEVEKMTPPYMRDAKNKVGETPFELFSKENQDQVSQGLKWTQDCMIVATLIITVAFAVAFTVPGGYKGDNGLPFFIHQRSLLVFVVTDAISLFSSSISLLVFLSVLTSRHGQQDFMYSLPKKLMIGLLTLFISVATMMVTFSASFFVLYHDELKWLPILISVSATLPVLVFAVLQLPLWVDMIRSMCDSRYLFKPTKRMLYGTKLRLHANSFTSCRFSYKSIIKRTFFKRG